MARYAFLVDVTRCSGCHSCFLACKDEHIGNDRGVTGPLCEGKTFIRVNEVEYGTADKIKVDFHPIMCQQCQDPTCMKLNPGSLYKDQYGLIQIDEAKAAGNEKLVKACPYGAIVWNAERNVPQKCTMCAHRIAEGKAPRCADACPAQALVWGDLDDPNSEISLALKERNLVLEEYKGKHVAEDKKSVTLRIQIGADDKTLTTEEIEAVVGIVTKKLTKNLGAEARNK